MENMELVCFQIISSAGMAKSSFVEAIKAGEKGTLILQVTRSKKERTFKSGAWGSCHIDSKRSSRGKTPISLLLLHAEDQMMSAELTELMASTILSQQKKILDLEAELSKKLPSSRKSSMKFIE